MNSLEADTGEQSGINEKVIDVRYANGICAI
jgi:hypothetical protein